MTYRNYVVATSIIIVGLAGYVAYLHYEKSNLVSNWWNAAIQDREEALRRINALESLLEDAQFNKVSTELQRHRQRSLTQLVGMMANQFRPRSPNMDYARRLFCAELPIALPEPRNGSDKIGVRMIRGTEPQCEHGTNNAR